MEAKAIFYTSWRSGGANPFIVPFIIVARMPLVEHAWARFILRRKGSVRMATGISVRSQCRLRDLHDVLRGRYAPRPFDALQTLKLGAPNTFVFR
jgi:hypothetical protein